MIDALARDWKPLVLCFVLASLVWFLVNERAGSDPAPSLLEPAASLAPSLDQP